MCICRKVSCFRQALMPLSASEQLDPMLELDSVAAKLELPLIPTRVLSMLLARTPIVHMHSGQLERRVPPAPIRTPERLSSLYRSNVNSIHTAAPSRKIIFNKAVISQYIFQSLWPSCHSDLGGSTRTTWYITISQPIERELLLKIHQSRLFTPPFSYCSPACLNWTLRIGGRTRSIANTRALQSRSFGSGRWAYPLPPPLPPSPFLVPFNRVDLYQFGPVDGTCLFTQWKTRLIALLIGSCRVREKWYLTNRYLTLLFFKLKPLNVSIMFYIGSRFVSRSFCMEKTASFLRFFINVESSGRISYAVQVWYKVGLIIDLKA